MSEVVLVKRKFSAITGASDVNEEDEYACSLRFKSWENRVEQITVNLPDFFTREIIQVIAEYSRLRDGQVKILTDKIMDDLKKEYGLTNLAYDGNALTDETLLQFELVQQMLKLYFQDLNQDDNKEDNKLKIQLDALRTVETIHISTMYGPLPWCRRGNCIFLRLMAMKMCKFRSFMATLIPRHATLKTAVNVVEDFIDLFGFDSIKGTLYEETTTLLQKWIDEAESDPDYHEERSYGLKVVQKKEFAIKFDGVNKVHVGLDTTLKQLYEFLKTNHPRLEAETSELCKLYGQISLASEKITQTFSKVQVSIHQWKKWHTFKDAKYILDAYLALIDHSFELNANLCWNDPTLEINTCILITPPKSKVNLSAYFLTENGEIVIPAEFDTESFLPHIFIKRIVALVPHLQR